MFTMMMSATPRRKLSFPLSILLNLRGKTRSKLDLKEKLTRYLGGMFPQEVAVLGSGSPMPEPLCFPRPMMNIL